jgi:hypothetical protein
MTGQLAQSFECGEEDWPGPGRSSVWLLLFLLLTTLAPCNQFSASMGAADQWPMLPMLPISPIPFPPFAGSFHISQTPRESRTVALGKTVSSCVTNTLLFLSPFLSLRCEKNKKKPRIGLTQLSRISFSCAAAASFATRATRTIRGGFSHNSQLRVFASPSACILLLASTCISHAQLLLLSLQQQFRAKV